MFLGTHTPRLDDKGRLALPAKFRPGLEGGLVICKGQEHCLYVFPTAEFHQITVTPAQRADHRPPGPRLQPRSCSPARRRTTRTARAGSPIPLQLREYAGLTKDCAVIGANNRIEVWDAEAWQAYLDGNEQAFADIAEEVLPGVF